MFDSEDSAESHLTNSEDVHTCFKESKKLLKNYQTKADVQNVEISFPNRVQWVL